MPLDNVRAAIENLFQANWNLADAEVDWSGFKRDDVDLPFVRLHVQPGASINQSISPGDSCVTRTGNIAVMIFIAADIGLGPAWQLADKAKDIFENKRVGALRTFETNVYDRGKTDKGSAYMFEASTYYEMEEA